MDKFISKLCLSIQEEIFLVHIIWRIGGVEEEQFSRKSKKDKGTGHLSRASTPVLKTLLIPPYGNNSEQLTSIPIATKKILPKT